MKALHLGDGAYATHRGAGEFCITANHHDPDQASDRVYLDRAAALALAQFIADPEEMGEEV